MKCMISPPVRDALKILESRNICTVDDYVASISRPADKFYLRVNTRKISPSALLERLESAHENLVFGQDGEIPEAIHVKFVPGVVPRILDKKVEVDKYAGEAVHIGAPLFAPGLKVPLSKFRAGELVSMVHHFKPSWGATPAEILCGNGIAEYSSSEIGTVAHGTVVKTTEAPHISPSIQDWSEFKEGLILDQNFPSMVASTFLSPSPGCTVLDVCAGPGGKTTHLAQLSGDLGIIHAIERSGNNIRKMNGRLERLGLKCVEVHHSRVEKASDLISRISPGMVMFDPPCSALGLRPKFFVDFTRKALEDFSRNQLRILGQVLPVLKSGTKIVYSTCTVTLDENEALIAKIVSQFDVRITKPHLRVGSPGLEVGTLSKQETGCFTRFYPTVDDCVGFFIACLEKN
ncbi:MAG: methyltransferase domain-containing protein [Promethearchaeota archaeon]